MGLEDSRDLEDLTTLAFSILFQYMPETMAIPAMVYLLEVQQEYWDNTTIFYRYETCNTMTLI